MKIQNVTDASFGRYGKVVTEFSYQEILKEMEHTPLPEDVVYVASVDDAGFCVRGTPYTPFSYRVTAKQRGYEKTRLEVVE